MITWDTRALYERPTVGVCEVSGAYETGRYYIRDGKRIFVGDTAAPDSVEGYVAFRTALGAVGEFKRGYSKSDRWAAKLAPKKPAKKR